MAWTPPTPVAKTKGTILEADGQKPMPATAEIISVQASDISTILTWQLSSTTDVGLQGWSLTSLRSQPYPDMIRLVDPVGKKSYWVNTLNLDRYPNCICAAYPIHVASDPVRMTAAYPPLPASVTSISVRIPNFAPVSVPVTR